MSSPKNEVFLTKREDNKGVCRKCAVEKDGKLYCPDTNAEFVGLSDNPESFSAEGQISWEHENESMFTTGHERTIKNFQGIPYQISYKWELWIYEEEIDDFADDEVKRIIDESIQNCIDSFDLEHEDMEEEDFELKYESKGVDNQEMSGYTLSYDFKAYRSLGKGAESFSAEYRPKWKEEKKHHHSNPTYTCSFQIKEDEDDDYYATHKLQIQKVKGKWVVHELDTRYVTPNARLIKDRYNKEEYWRVISDPYDTVDEAKKSMVEEITQSKCHHNDGYKLADPTQTFYDGHEYVDFVCVNCGAIGYGDMGENDFRGIETRWAESFSAESPTDDELETWSERQNDGSMKVTIDEDGESHTELTYKDGDLTELKRFMAEVFEADRKARRRTTLTWARGIQPGFGTIDEGVTYFSQPRPYDNDQYYYDSQYSNDNAYHIKGLPPGFHIQLWKAPKRNTYWQAYLKSPNTDEWKEVYDKSKRNLMVEVLGWYNDAIAVPEETELSPIQQLMIGQGMISGEIQIYRIHIPAAIQKKKDKATGEVVSKTIIPEKIQYHFAGGSEALAPTLFATYDGDLEFNTDDIPSTILHFCRGLIYIGVETAGNVRSVNRYNNDRKQWVSSGPAWFQNMCKQGIKDLQFAQDWDGTYEINGIDFLRFYGSRSLPENKDVDLGNDIERPMFQVRLPIEDGEEVVDDGWITPRPSTQRKMYENKGHEGTVVGFENEVGILNKCVAKYQPQTFDEIQNTMLEGKVTQNSGGWRLDGSAPAGEIMCRRFKKK